MAKKTSAAVKRKVAKVDGPRVVGEVVMRAHGSVRPNSWNPNEFTPFMLQSLKHGLQTDGWLISQALLVWGTDEAGKRRDVIIDGEHRWQVAGELGFEDVPMVFLNGLSEIQAKALTVKMDSKRGKFGDALPDLLREIQHELGADDMSFDLGIEAEALMSMLAEPTDLPGDDPIDGDGSPPGDVPSGMASHVKMVQLFFNKEQHEEFLGLVKELAPRYETKDVTATTLEAMRRARAAKKPRT